MTKIRSDRLKEAVFIYCAIYTLTTILTSIGYLISGINTHPSGSWPDIMRALIVLIGLAAYLLTKYLPIKNVILKALFVYVPTIAFAIFTVWLSQYIEPLAENAYRDAFINYTDLFILASITAVIVKRYGSREKSPA